jgi:hypothetical protein
MDGDMNRMHNTSPVKHAGQNGHAVKDQALFDATMSSMVLAMHNSIIQLRKQVDDLSEEVKSLRQDTAINIDHVRDEMQYAS